MNERGNVGPPTWGFVFTDNGRTYFFFSQANRPSIYGLSLADNLDINSVVVLDGVTVPVGWYWDDVNSCVDFELSRAGEAGASGNHTLSIAYSSIGTLGTNHYFWSWSGVVYDMVDSQDWAGRIIPLDTTAPPAPSVIHSFPRVGRFQLCRVLYVAPPGWYILNEGGAYILLESNDKIEVE